jgi:histidinol phosphatase-like PHP family hydrolase
VDVVRAPSVHVLGHPTGRKYDARAGVVVNWRRVFDEAASREVAIEIDGDPSRQDCDFELASLALEAGCLFALDSDAHAVDELSYTDFARAHAALAGIPEDRVVNCWPLERLLEWLDRRRA